MSNSISFKTQRELAIKFVEANAKHLRDGVTGTAVDADFINELKSIKNKSDFIERITDVEHDDACYYYVFGHSYSSKGTDLAIWTLPKGVAKDIDEWENEGEFFNITETRIANVQQLFDNVYKKTTKKKPAAKKTVSKKPVEKKIGDFVTVKNDVAFFDVDDEKLVHAMYSGGNNLDLCQFSKSDCGTDNQIDHVINAYNCAIREFEQLVKELTKAKDAGATHVIDESYSSYDEFNFNG